MTMADERSKDWWLKRARAEGNVEVEIAAGTMTDTPDDLVKRLRGVHHAMLDWAEDFRRVGSVDGEMSERSRAELLKAAASRIEALESRQRVLCEALEHVTATPILSGYPDPDYFWKAVDRCRRALAGDAG